jgi:hypothetical protein
VEFSLAPALGITAITGAVYTVVGSMDVATTGVASTDGLISIVTAVSEDAMASGMVASTAAETAASTVAKGSTEAPVTSTAVADSMVEVAASMAVEVFTVADTGNFS